jgi:hypothetical protein
VSRSRRTLVAVGLVALGLSLGAAAAGLQDAIGSETPPPRVARPPAPPPPPAIVGDRFVDSVGGGISQVATMLYNGAFFAGLELVEHQPHTIFIDRYPPGREATISWGGPELVFRNDWPAPLVIELDTTARSITVRFVTERLGRRVETTTGEPYAHRPDGGFTIEYTRRVYRGDVLRRDERFRWTYDSGPPVPATGR